MSKKTKRIAKSNKACHEKLSRVSNQALIEMADLADDMMVIMYNAKRLKKASMFQDMLTDLVMEQTRREQEGTMTSEDFKM